MHKVFISYSWHPIENKNRVKDLADKLISDGIDVVIDIYDLQPGNDRFYYMERMVTDPSIEKVLIICNSIYSNKADMRQGGVGTESMIITPEVYSSVSQTKFIPILFERDKNGEPCLPVYLRSKFYFDFSDPVNYIQEYNNLVNHIKGINLKSNISLNDTSKNVSLKKDFSIGDIELPYLPIISSWNKGVNEYRYGDIIVN